MAFEGITPFIDAAIALILEDNEPIRPIILGDWNQNNDDDLPLALREAHVRSWLYVERVVIRYSAADFRSHFRLSRTAVEELYLRIGGPDIAVDEGRPSVPLKHSLLLALWILATPESFRSVADRFGFERGHAHKMCMQIYIKMYSLRSTWIKWPRGPAALDCLEAFQAHGFPGVMGVVDGCHIPIPGPTNDDSYFNRKQFHSILLQGVCDNNLKFIDIFCGMPGSAHDARLWAESPLGIALAANPDDHLPHDCHLLGDSAYPIRTYLIPIIKDNGHLTNQMKQFNTKLSSIRVAIEHAFGRLKGIFRRLKYLDVQNLKFAKYYIIAACILHNIVLDERKHLGDLEVEVHVEGEGGNNDDIDDDDHFLNPFANESGVQKRIRLMNAIIPHNL